MHTIILLTSAGMSMQDEILKILPKPPSAIKLAHIINASKFSKDLSWRERDRQRMVDCGFQIEDIDIEGKREIELMELLKDKDIIYVQGGDPFYLLKQIRLSGFEQVVRNLITKGTIYIGSSAGSMVAMPTLETALWTKPERNRHGLTDTKAMNLVPVLATVHYMRDPAHSAPEFMKRVEEGKKNAIYPVYMLTDDQGLLVIDRVVRLVGAI